MLQRLKKHHTSFKNAFAGLYLALRSEHNFQLQMLISLLVILLSLYLHISQMEFIAVMFTILLVLSTEMINTAIEELTDFVTREWREEARIVKDVSAGMVLLTAIGAVVIGLIIFLPKITVLFS
ncbi:MAG: diacylglycerol kinase [Candidatus Gottesmanbacteria bacterium GW2011_GWC2_39_8]|uniref:Diacylglycerol kinase n=1 Tax=Candidatus Gottesmanbacteria bacterium GW2011_GWC2_39_8 TaxID=1618450 RepID=A0A0G0QAT3_9BACT|nr:MAG: diacylglycerol kinase [Candidatus Gottesmanbacteria bacterium GW2011_GWC2_39_8]